MINLQQLIRLYLIGSIDFTEFRAEFVQKFLATSQPSELESTVNCIESSCDDFSEGMIGEAALRSKLVRVLPVVNSTIFPDTVTNVVFTDMPSPKASAPENGPTNSPSSSAQLLFA
jgi:hypothetical protein